MRDIVYFDLETQRSFGDVGGAANKDKMGISVGVTYSTKQEEYRVFGESETDELVDQLRKADFVVGYNHIYFDYPVLQGYTLLELADVTMNLDMMVDIEKKLGHRLKLDALASASLGTGKTADGLDALKWWQQYKKTGDNEPLMKIAKYCAFDVKVTKCVHEYGVKHGFLKYKDRAGVLQQVEIEWG